jgi:serine/threonine-protein kinase
MNDSITPHDLVGALAEEFLARHREGLKPSLESYAAANPELADEIRRLFPALLMMEELKPRSGDATGSFDAAAVVVRGTRLERLGDFRILREVGRGGMGVVYEAEQESLGRRVALKVLGTPALQNAAQVRRFEREARAAARLHHTNIVPVFGVGQQEGLRYYVMQFIQGLGLDDVIAELKRLRSSDAADGQNVIPRPDGPARPGDDTPIATGIVRSLMSEGFVAAPPVEDDASETEPGAVHGSGTPAPDRSSDVVLGPSGLLSGSGPNARYWRGVARIGVQVARALEYAHSQGMFHRDVKPSNLLLDLQGTAWLADFGLAKAVEGENLTHTGDIVGTIRYMAPERFRGRCDARADVYALGLTLYEMLALRPAFEQADRQVLVQQVMEQEPPRLQKLDPAVPRDLETVVHKAIEKDPAGRYPTAAALAVDLSLFLDGKPVRARPTGTLERCWKWAKRRPAVAALLAGLAVAVLIGLAAVTWQWRAAVRARNEALAARDEAQRTLKIANAAVNTYFTQVSEEQLLNEPGMQPLRKRLLEQALPYYKAFVAQKGNDPALRLDLASAYLRWGDIASQLGSNGEAESNLKSAIAQFEDVLRSEPADIEARIGLSKAHQGLAQQWLFTSTDLALTDQTEFGRREAELAIASWNAVLSTRPKDVESRQMLARCYDLVGVSWGLVGNTKAAVPSLQRAVEILSEVAKDAPADTDTRRRLAKALNNLANCYRYNGWLTENERGSNRTVTLLEALRVGDASSLALRRELGFAKLKVGMARLLAGSIHPAETALTEARRLCEKLVRENPRVPEYLNDLGNVDVHLGRAYLAQGRTGLAQRVLDEGFAREQDALALNPSHREALSTLPDFHLAFGLLEAELGRPQSSSRWNSKALQRLAELHRQQPDDQLCLFDFFETLIACHALDMKARRPTTAGRITEIRRLVRELGRRAEQDPNNLWARAEATSGYLVLAEHSLELGKPPEALESLGQASAVLGLGLQSSLHLLRLRSLEVRIETLRSEVLMRLGKIEEASTAARRAIHLADPLARDDPAYLFEAACAHALLARLGPAAPSPPSAAIAALRGAVEAGFDNIYKLENDDRLAPLRTRDDFRALMRLVKEKGRG